MQILTNAPVGSAEWKARRTGKLSASRVADALGHGRRTPLELWMELTGKVEPEDIGDKPWVIAGQRLESVVADWYADETGRVLQDSPGLLQDARLPFLVGTPDRLIPPQDQNPPGVLEIKTTNAFNRAAWETDNPPIDYQIQLQTYLRLTGCEWGSLACLIGGQEFVQRDQAIDPVFQEWLEEEITRFWELVQSDTPPDPRAKVAVSLPGRMAGPGSANVWAQGSPWPATPPTRPCRPPTSNVSSPTATRPPWPTTDYPWGRPGGSTTGSSPDSSPPAARRHCWMCPSRRGSTIWRSPWPMVKGRWPMSWPAPRTRCS